MADLTASDVTLTIQRDLDIMRQDTGMLMVTAEVAFGDGALTYTADGVPLPAIGNFGFRREVRNGFVAHGAFQDGYIYTYDKTEHSIRITDMIGEESGTFAPAATTIGLILLGE